MSDNKIGDTNGAPKYKYNVVAGELNEKGFVIDKDKGFTLEPNFLLNETGYISVELQENDKENNPNKEDVIGNEDPNKTNKDKGSEQEIDQ